MSVAREDTQLKLDLVAQGNMRHPPRGHYTVANRLEEQAVRYSSRPFLLYGDQSISYAQANARANQVAHAAHALGLKCGDIAALMMENRPEYFITWMGLAKIGVTVALINTNLKGRPLAHSLDVTGSRVFICGEECLPMAASLGTPPTPIWYLEDHEQPAAPSLKAGFAMDFGRQLENASKENPPDSVRAGLLAEQPALYIFTSGTTGLPKAVNTSHMRWLGVGDGMSAVMGIQADDVFYCYLPLYHGAAGMSLSSSALAQGAAIALRRKFSAREFWPDVRRYGVTTCQYIGEICRYLMNQPESPQDKQHQLRRILGAGLGSDIWARFQERFNIPQIFEGWGSTEANCSLLNVDNKIGSCGRVAFWDKTNIRVLKYDVESDCHVRDAEGRYVAAKAGDIGEVIGFIVNHPDVGAGRFEGYTSPEATEKKTLRDVFQSGDAWFSSGDLFRFDEDGYFYFVDRIGDTFRWKSENVSTTEVAEALADLPGLEIINVYGVKVPGQEGRAGMASLVMQSGARFDPKALFKLSQERLPRYAAPLFLRLSPQADITATFKLRKVDLQKQGYSPRHCGEPLYVRDEANNTYAPYSEDLLLRLGIAPFENQP